MIELDIHKDGRIYWFNNYCLSNNNGPSVIHANNDMFWHKAGELHRLNGPAVSLNNNRLFYIDGSKYNELAYWIEVQNYDKT